MFHAKQWHYSLHRDFQQLHSIHFTRRNPRDSSSTNSTFRRQRALRVILHAEGKEIFYPVYKDLQGIPDIPVIHDIQPSRHYYTFQHLPVQIQYLPVLSSASRDSTRSSISSIRMLILHSDWFPPETPLSASRIQDFLQTFHSSKKGRCCDMSQYDTIGKIELIPASVLSTDKTNC